MARHNPLRLGSKKSCFEYETFTYVQYIRILTPIFPLIIDYSFTHLFLVTIEKVN